MSNSIFCPNCGMLKSNCTCENSSNSKSKGPTNLFSFQKTVKSSILDDEIPEVYSIDNHKLDEGTAAYLKEIYPHIDDDIIEITEEVSTEYEITSLLTTDEIDAIVDFVKKQGKPKYLISDEIFQKGNTSFQSDTDPLLYDAMNFIFDRGYATVSSLQTRLRIGFNRAARIIETLEMSGWIGEPQGAQKQREIKISREEFEAIKDETRF